MKNYKIHKQVKTTLGGEKIDLTVDGDNKDELIEIMEQLMPDPIWTRLFGRKKRGSSTILK